MILSYQSFSAASFDILAEAASFGLARLSSLCQSALSVPCGSCKAKRKCSLTDGPSKRELRLLNHLKNYSVVPPLKIG
jgi:hypothetical protein